MKLIRSRLDKAAATGKTSPATGLFWFLFFSAAGVLMLAAAVLLPEHAALLELEARRDALAHQVQCERRLAAYNDRLIEAMKSDPVLRARLMIRHCSYRPAGSRTLAVDPPLTEPAVPARVMQQAMSAPAPRDDALAALGRRLSDPLTRTGAVVLSLVLIAAASLLFALPRRPATRLGQAPHTQGARFTASANAES